MLLGARWNLSLHRQVMVFVATETLLADLVISNLSLCRRVLHTLPMQMLMVIH